MSTLNIPFILEDGKYIPKSSLEKTNIQGYLRVIFLLYNEMYIVFTH